jgi:hypothetical protein
MKTGFFRSSANSTRHNVLNCCVHVPTLFDSGDCLRFYYDSYFYYGSLDYPSARFRILVLPPKRIRPLRPEAQATIMELTTLDCPAFLWLIILAHVCSATGDAASSDLSPNQQRSGESPVLAIPRQTKQNPGRSCGRVQKAL